MSAAAARHEVVGVGRPGDEPELDAEALAVLRERIGELSRGRRPPLEDVRAAAPPQPLPAALIDAVGAESASSPRPRTGSGTRPGAATSIWPGCASGKLDAAPDAVVLPANAEDVRRVLGVCPRRASPSSRSAAAPASSAGSRRCAESTRGSSASTSPALRGVEVDRALADRAARGRAARPRGGSGARRPQGLTLGHFPQSFEYATIGGFAATRSAGQASSGYGRFDDLVSAVRCRAGGRAAHARDAAHRRRPSLRELSSARRARSG